MTTPAGIDAPLDQPLFGGGTASTTDVPGRFEVGIAGRGYMVDHAQDLNGFRNTHFARSSVPALRNQADTANTPGEQSLNREDLWRRAAESWHHGSGQTYFDRATDSDNSRFSTSKGVDPWTKWALSLLPDTTSIRSSASTNLRLTTAGGYTYLADGNSLLFTSDVTASPVVWTTVTGTPASPCLWVTTDGNTIYASYGGSGVYTTTRGAASAAAYNPLVCSVLGYVKGRLMAANNNSIYNITSGSAPVPLLTQANTDFTWVGFAEGPGYIFAAGSSGNRSLIYKITIQSDATALTSPVVAGELPTGETVRSIKGYLGLLLVGTDSGLRLGSISNNGDITFGSLIPTSSPVYNFEPADRFVWYGLTNYDGVSTGLGRLDLTAFLAPLTPAYASDLMVTGQGTVRSISTAQGLRLFTVDGLGVYAQSTNKVPSGTLTSGRITYGVADDKVAMFLDLRTSPLAGSVSASLSGNGKTPVSIGTFSTAGATSPTYPLVAGQVRAEFFETTLTLTRSAALTTGPTVTRTVLRSYPAPTRSATWIVPVILHTAMQDSNRSEYYEDPLGQRQFIETLWRSQQLVTFQEGTASYTVLVDDFRWIPIKRSGDFANTTFDGTLVVSLKEVTQ